MERIIITVKIEEDYKYVIPRSNFKSSAVCGIPCEVISKPHSIRFEGKFRETIVVKSCVTGEIYRVPTDWILKFNTLEEANKVSKFPGSTDPKMENILGETYYPYRNVYDEFGTIVNLYNKPTLIVSTPYLRYCASTRKTEFFIKVLYNKKLYRTIWGEWGLCSHPLDND